MSSHEHDDLKRLQETFGSDFDYAPVNTTEADAVESTWSASAQAPNLSALKGQRLGAAADSDSVAADASYGQGGAGGVAPSARDRVYLKKARTESDVRSPNVFAPRYVVISPDGKATETG